MRAPCDTSQAVQAAGKKLLVVLTDLCANAALVDHLSRQGWSVEYVPDNESAMSAVHEKVFDLIVTGETTTAKHDLELLRKIRIVHPHTRMIILTNDRTPGDVIAAFRERAFSLFSTPYELEDLVEMIRLAIEGPCWDDGIELLSGTPAWIRLLVRCEQSTADRLVQFFQEMIDLPEKEKSAVAYAFREMLLNAIRYGGKFDPQQYVEISYVRVRKMIACRVKDPGEGFSLTELYHAAVTNPEHNPLRHILIREAEGLAPGGYGILLSRHMVDELLYNEKGNEVLLVKYLGESAPAVMANVV
jgi:anti-sigma regulatory factor (Ser/Thr protein kinase)